MGEGRSQKWREGVSEKAVVSRTAATPRTSTKTGASMAHRNRRVPPRIRFRVSGGEGKLLEYGGKVAAPVSK